MAETGGFKIGLPKSNPASSTYTAVTFDKFHNPFEPPRFHFLMYIFKIIVHIDLYIYKTELLILPLAPF